MDGLTEDKHGGDTHQKDPLDEGFSSHLNSSKSSLFSISHRR